VAAVSVTPIAARSKAEPWLTKAQLADRLNVSVRWIDYQRSKGMPSSKWGGVVRFRLSEVEGWLERSAA
jgi:excisionase family DNA binding protein